MTKTQTLLRLLKYNEKPDSPIFHPILMHFAARFNGTTYSAFASDYRVLVESNISCMEHFGHDAVSVISDPYRETAAFGAQVTYPKDSVPLCTDKIVKTIDDVRWLKNPDVYKAERTLDRIQGVEYFRSHLGDDVPVIGWIEGPLAEACDLAGVSEMLLKIALEPDFVKALMDTCLVTAKDFAQAQIEAGSCVIGVGDAICSQISAEMYEEFVLTLHCELFDFIHSHGAYVKLHICGNITHLLSKLRETGADIVDIDWMVNFDDAHSGLGDTVAVCGNLDPVSVIQNVSAPELYKLSKTLTEGEKGRKFIFSGGCEITVNTPHVNLEAMREAVRK